MKKIYTKSIHRFAFACFLFLYFITCPFTEALPRIGIPDSVLVTTPAEHTLLVTDSVYLGPEFPNLKLSPVAKGATYVVAGAAVWAATFIWLDEPIQRLAQQSRTKVGDGILYLMDPIGRQKYWAPISGTIALGGLVANNANIQKVGTVALSGLFLSGGFTTLIKNTTHRHRPGESSRNDRFDWGSPDSKNTSLPSAHATVAFVMATSVAEVYGAEYRFASPIAYSMATMVAVSRLNNNAHWATDVMAGAAVGYLSVKCTSYIYDYAYQKLNLRKQRLILTPQAGLNHGMVRGTLVF